MTGKTRGQTAVLEIWETKDGFCFRLLEPGEGIETGSPLVCERAVQVNRDTLASLCARMENLITAVRPGPADLEACGRALFDQLIGPLDPLFRAKVAALDTPLLISSGQSDVVWELLHDKQDYWGLKYRLGRQIRTGIKPPVQPADKKPARCLVVANPSGDRSLEALEDQAQALMEQLQAWGLECRYLARSQATPQEVLMELSSGRCDIFHYNGHVAKVSETGRPVKLNEEGDWALQLNGGWLRSFEIQRAAHGVNMVFLNGCQSARSVENISNAFLLKGAALAMGTIFKVPVYGARLFAEKFYTLALTGQPVGEAFREARKTVQADNRSGNAWACFVMFGDPCLQLLEGRGDSHRAEGSLTLIDELLADRSGFIEKKFDDAAGRVLAAARDYAINSCHNRVTGTHLFLGLCSEPEGPMARLISGQGMQPAAVIKTVSEGLGGLGVKTGSRQAQVGFSAGVKYVLVGAEKIADDEGSSCITDRHIYQAFLTDGGGETAKVFRTLGLNLHRANRQVSLTGESERVSTEAPLLHRLGRDLTAEAAAGKLRPVIGREREIERLKSILLRRREKAVLLVGKEGVGKSSIVEGLAERIANGTVAPPLCNARIVEIPACNITAGLSEPGGLAGLAVRIIDEAALSETIVFIDELHSAAGGLAGDQGGLNAADLLKPFLTCKDIRVIAATRPGRLYRTIELDPGLAGCFKTVKINEPLPDEALFFLHGLRGYYESRMGFRFSDEAIQAAVDLSVSYIKDRCLPDKAIQLLEEACAMALQDSKRGVELGPDVVKMALSSLTLGNN